MVYEGTLCPRFFKVRSSIAMQVPVSSGRIPSRRAGRAMMRGSGHSQRGESRRGFALPTWLPPRWLAHSGGLGDPGVGGHNMRDLEEADFFWLLWIDINTIAQGRRQDRWSYCALKLERYAILGLACPPQAGQESRARLAKLWADSLRHVPGPCGFSER